MSSPLAVVVKLRASYMKKNMIRVNCFFKANEGKYNDALEAAIALVAASQQDEGVVSYDCFESATRGEIFLICETWKDKAALEAHTQTPHFKEYVGQLEAAGMLQIEQFEF